MDECSSPGYIWRSIDMEAAKGMVLRRRDGSGCFFVVDWTAVNLVEYGLMERSGSLTSREQG